MTQNKIREIQEYINKNQENNELFKKQFFNSFQIRDNKLLIFTDQHQMYAYDGTFVGFFDTMDSFSLRTADWPYRDYLRPSQIMKIVDLFSENELTGFLMKYNPPKKIKKIIDSQEQNIDYLNTDIQERYLK